MATKNTDEHGVTEIKKSSIHGYGVFALCDMKKGQGLDFSDMPTEFKGFNHSCGANITNTSEEQVMEIIADIKKGEELVLDYRIFFDADEYPIYKCNCMICRKTKIKKPTIKRRAR